MFGAPSHSGFATSTSLSGFGGTTTTNSSTSLLFGSSSSSSPSPSPFAFSDFSTGSSPFAAAANSFPSLSPFGSPSPNASGFTTGHSHFGFPNSPAEAVPEVRSTRSSSDSGPSDSPDLTEIPPPPVDTLAYDHDSFPETTTFPVLNLEFMVQNNTDRVVFAESDKNLVDLIFSFLTLPVGTIINLLKDKSPPTVIGSMNGLYKSVENLDVGLLRTEACKDMLLHLRRFPEAQCRKLKLMLERKLEPIKCFYFCRNSNCRKESKGLLTEFPGVYCHCGCIMNQSATLSESLDGAFDNEGVGEFLKGGPNKFLISDDLQVMPGSTSPSIMLLKKLGIVDANELERQNVSIGPPEMLQLLRLSLLSDTPLTHFLKQGKSETVELERKDVPQSQEKKSLTCDSKRMSLKIFMSKSRNKVLYAECGEDFVDFLFSFLTFPLGSILKLLGGKSSVGCVDSLYRSVKDLSNDDYLKSEELKNMLLYPKLAPFFACENQLLHIEEGPRIQYLLGSHGESKREWFVRPLTSEFNGISFGEGLVRLSMVNPKSTSGESSSGGGFVKGPAKFMVTDDLVVTLLSPMESISFLGKLDVPITDVDEKLVKLGEDEALNLLNAALISETALTDVFYPKEQCFRR